MDEAKRREEAGVARFIAFLPPDSEAGTLPHLDSMSEMIAAANGRTFPTHQLNSYGEHQLRCRAARVFCNYFWAKASLLCCRRSVGARRCKLYRF